MDDSSLIKDEAIPPLPVPKDFLFPFPPYSIQVSFMKSLFKVLDEGKIGIFESPTGTGKSLSMICGALTWLNNYNAQRVLQMESTLQVHETKKPAAETTGLHWFDAYSEVKKEELRILKTKKQYEKHQKEEEKYKLMKERIRTKQAPLSNEDREFNLLFKHKADVQNAVKEELLCVEKADNDVEEEMLLNEFSSDEDESISETKDDVEEEEDSMMRIVYCSRTHSQLSQFVHEVKKSPFGDCVRLVVLGSRQSTCINDAVRKLKSLSLINDHCLNLQRNKKSKETKLSDDGNVVKRKKSSQGCPFNKRSPMNAVKENVLVDTHDIEQLVALGKKHLGCPYYSARLAMPEAQLIVVPYNTLLHKSTREASNVIIKGSVVIIDEAHNLLDAITSIHSAQITASQIAQAYSQLFQYRDRYKHRFKPKNVLHINQLLFVLQAFMKQLGGKTGVTLDELHVNKQETKLLLRGVFLTDASIYNINLFDLLDFCKRSELSQKLRSFTEKYQPSVKIHTKAPESKTSVSLFLKQLSSGAKKTVAVDETKEIEKTDVTTSSPILQIEEFISALTNNAGDSRVLLSKTEPFSKSLLKVLILNPATHFKEIVNEARAIVVAGGTMQPISEFRDQLFINAGASPDRIVHFSCGHVIEGDRLLPIALSCGPSGVEFNFSFQNRQKQEMLDELGRTICNMCNVIPGGIVCFFPSYEYEKTVYDYWDKKGFLLQMSKKKKIFREPRTSSMVEQILAEYSDVITSALRGTNGSLTGAILLSVVGGKMSEGINFSDDLGRCVVMVGLPFPNVNSPELKEKMDYLNATYPSIDGRLPGQIHYENLCMKAVNQSIGRAIRHQNDYAVILLLDSRYSRPSIQSALPQWIGEHLKTLDKFGAAFSFVCKFFSSKKK